MLRLGPLKLKRAGKRQRNGVEAIVPTGVALLVLRWREAGDVMCIVPRHKVHVHCDLVQF